MFIFSCEKKNQDYNDYIIIISDFIRSNKGPVLAMATRTLV